MTGSGSSRAVAHLQIINRNDEYGTPPYIMREGCRMFNVWPTLDVAATDEMHCCPFWFTAADDALTYNWRQDFWCNPPYSRVRDFLQYGREQVRAHGVHGLFLTFSKTDTAWWHDLVEADCLYKFIRHRLHFLKPPGVPACWQAPYPSVYIYMGPETLGLNRNLGT